MHSFSFEEEKTPMLSVPFVHESVNQIEKKSKQKFDCFDFENIFLSFLSLHPWKKAFHQNSSST